MNSRTRATVHRRAAGWSNTYTAGVATEFWGAAPPCTGTPACKSNSGKAQCCTADCSVLGVGAPSWSLVNPSNPTTGGVKATYLGASPTSNDPFWCPLNPATGAMYRRQVTFQFQCDPLVATIQPVHAYQNTTNACHYTLLFRTSKACATAQ